MEREVSEIDRKLILKRNYLDKIYYHQTKDPIDQDELYIFVRKFFGEYLKLDYEFTYEELSQELNKVFIKPKVKEQIDNYLIRLSETEYLQDSSLGTQEINAYLTDLGEIIKEVIYEENSVILQPSIIKKVLKIGDSDSKAISEINALMDELNFHLGKANVDAAKNSYNNVMKIYDALGKSDKKTLHARINDAYMKLQELIKNPDGKASAQSMYSDSKKQDAENLSNAPSPNASVNASSTDAGMELPQMPQAKKSKGVPQENIMPTFDPIVDNSIDDISAVNAAPSGNIVIKPKDDSNTNVNASANPANANSTISFNAPSYDSGSNIGNSGLKIPDMPDIPKESMENIPAYSAKNADVNAGTVMINSNGNVIFGADPNIQSTPQSIQKNPASSTPASPTPDSSSLASSSQIAENSQPKIFDEEENRLDNYSKELNKRIESLRTPAVQPSSSLAASDPSAPDSSNFLLLGGSSSMPSISSTNMDSKQSPASKSMQSISQATQQPIIGPAIESNDEQLSKLTQLLSRINDDILIEKIDGAKKLYKDALLIYRSFDDQKKALCYSNFYSTFKKLDEALHQKSLHDLADKHMSASPSSNRLAQKVNDSHDEEYVPESLDVLKLTTLPVIMDNDPQTLRVFELIEESYFNISKKNSNLAMLKYFKALDLYKRLTVEDKKKTYSSLHELFKNLSSKHTKTKKAAM